MNKINITLLLAAAFLLLHCAEWKNPEDSGGEIIAVPEGLWCEFNISEDEQWLQYVGNTFKDHRNEYQQRQTLFTNLETGRTHFPEPDNEVKEMIKNGLGPGGLGCFSPDQNSVYYSRTVLKRDETKRTEQAGSAERPAGKTLSVPARGVERYFYKINLSNMPLTMVKVDQIECMHQREPLRPEIRVEQTSDKEIRFYSPGGNLLVTHRPRGFLSSRITVFDPAGDHWQHSFSAAPRGNRVAYLINEEGPLGFAAPAAGYWLDISKQETTPPKFLAASVYSFQWSNQQTLYACTSHTEYRRVIARWRL